MSNKHQIFFAYCLLAIAALWLSSCSHSPFADYEKTANGLQYKFYTKGSDTVRPKYGEIVKVKMAKRMGDSVLESTKPIDPNGIDQYLREPAFKGALEEGIRLMAVGDSATFLISTDSINKYYPSKDSSKNFKPNTYLAFDIKLVQIKTVEEMRKQDELRRLEYVRERKDKGPLEFSQYIQDNHIEIKPTPSGLYVIETEKGKGASPKEGDSVLVHYTGSFLNGTVFDSSVKRNQPLGFTLGKKRVIPGLEEAVKMMKKGTVATIILPSSLCYDSTGIRDPRNGKYFIPPYAALKFDLQLVDINPKK